MRRVLGRLARWGAARFGYKLIPRSPNDSRTGRYPDIDSDFLTKVHQRCAPFSMTPPSRTFALYEAVRYVVRTGVPGDVVECGVWRGGSAMVAALALLDMGVSDRDLFLYDTFTGMSRPTERDVDFRGQSALREWQQKQTGDGSSEWCAATLGEVAANMRSTGYPQERVHMVRGRVEDTLPGTMPASISVLRLDTDWYESTYHELTNLFPRLAPRGVLIIDDYGYWQGARQATDQYFAEQGGNILLHRIDETCRVAIKLD